MSGLFNTPGTLASAVATPAAGRYRWFLDTTGGTAIPAIKDSSGTVTQFGGLASEQIQDIVGALLVDSSVVDFTYDDAGNQITATIAANSITNSLMAQIATGTIKGRATAGTGDVENLTATQATALLNVATGSLKGLLSAADKTKLDAIATGATENTAVVIPRQTIPIATTYFGGLPLGTLVVGSHYRIWLNFSSAVIATKTVLVKFGTTTSNSDTTILTSPSWIGTAIQDEAVMMIDVNVETINATTGSVTCTYTMVRRLGGTTTGFMNVATPITAAGVQQTTTLDTTLTTNVLGVAVTATTSAAVILLSATIETVY